MGTRIKTVVTTSPVITLALALIPSAAPATSAPHCKANQVREARQVKVRGKRVREERCVVRTWAEVTAGHLIETPHPRIVLTSYVWVGSHPQSSMPMQGSLQVPVTFTITDATGFKRVASFKGVSESVCGVGMRPGYSPLALNETDTYRGEAVGGFPACPLAPTAVLAEHRLEITVSFAGNSTYGRSVSEPAVFRFRHQPRPKTLRAGRSFR